MLKCHWTISLQPPGMVTRDSYEHQAIIFIPGSQKIPLTKQLSVGVEKEAYGDQAVATDFPTILAKQETL